MVETKFYQLELPETTDLLPSTLVDRISGGTFPFQLLIEREASGPIQIVVSSSSEMLGLLEYSVASNEYNNVVRSMDVLKSSGYVTALSLKKAVSGRTLRVSDVLKSTFLTLRGGEKLRAVLSVRPLRRLKFREATAGKTFLAFSILFSGPEQRLKEIFPVAAHRKFWKLSSSWKAKHRFSLCPLETVDTLIPSFNHLSERTTVVSRRHVPFLSGPYEIEGVSLSTPSGLTSFHVNDAFFSGSQVVLGATGEGKTTYLARVVASLVKNGRSVLVLDPHGDLVRRALAALGPTAAHDRVVYADPLESAIGLNPVDVFRKLTNSRKMVSLISDSIIHVVKLTFSEEFWGPRVNFLLTGVLRPIAPIPESNFIDVLEVIDNPFSAHELADSTQDASDKQFLTRVLPAVRSEWWMSARNKIGLIALDDSARSMLCRRKNNLDLQQLIRSGKSLFLDMEGNRIGNEASTLIGSVVLGMFWLSASSARGRATIVIDEAQRYPSSIIEEIASQGRKFGVSVVFATQSPSFFSSKSLSSMGSNFPNRVALRLGETDSGLAAPLIGGVSDTEINSLKPFNLLANLSGEVAHLVTEPLQGGDDLRESLIRLARESYSTDDDATPSILASMEGQLFDVLQLVKMAMVLGKQSLSGLEETGALSMLNYSISELSILVERARSTGLVQKAHLKLTVQGQQEMYRLQGGILAGDEKHRSMVLALKDYFDSMHFLTYIPRQRLGREEPDLMMKTSGSIASIKFYVEVEVATKYQLDKRRKKVERAERNGAIPLFVFEESGPAVSAVKKGEFRTSLFFHLDGNVLRAPVGEEWVYIRDERSLMDRVQSLRKD